MAKTRSSTNRSAAPQPTEAEASEDAHTESNVATEEQDVSMSGDESSVIVEEEEDNSESEESESEEAEEPEAPAKAEESVASENGDSEARGGAESEAPEDADPVMEYDLNYMFHDAKVNLRTENLQFRLHEHMLQGFVLLKSKLDQVLWDEDEECKVITLDDSAKDIQNMLAVLYSKPYETHDWLPETLESTLKLATKYDHANLRDYAIRELDRILLEPIDRFRIARDYNISGWRSKAGVCLANRDGPITASEARILGFVIFANIAAAREKIQYTRGQRAATN